MAATPKRKISTMRKGKRRAAKNVSLLNVVYDKTTGKPRASHTNA